jgi:TatD DNase family protein
VLIDAHAHLDLYDDDVLESALEEIKQHGIFTISNSMDLPSYGRNLEIGQMSQLVLPTFGVHPWKAPESVHRLQELTDAIEQSLMLGEIGLDHQFVEDTRQYPAQREVFEFFLAAAKEQNKIVNLHTKGAEQEVLKLLAQYDIQRAIVHWYSGPLDLLRELAERGVCFTVGVEVLYSDGIKTIVRELPSELLLTETDNPGGFKWLTGVPGMPHMLTEVVEVLAKLREMTIEEMVQTLQSNFERLIGDNPRWSEMSTRFLNKNHSV